MQHEWARQQELENIGDSREKDFNGEMVKLTDTEAAEATKKAL